MTMRGKTRQNEERGYRIYYLIAIPFLILSIMYLVALMYYTTRFLNNTIINGVDCSGLTVEKAKQVIEKSETNYNLTIEFKEDEIVKILGDEIDLKTVITQEDLKYVKAQQRKGLLFKGKKYNIGKSDFDTNKLINKLMYLEQLQEDYMYNSSKNEYCYNKDKKRYELKIEDSHYLKYDQVYEVVSKAIKNKQENISLLDLYYKPQNNEALENMNTLISAKITYELPSNKQYTLDKDILNTWLVKNEKGEYVKEDAIWNNKIQEFVRTNLKEQIESCNSPISFIPTDSQESMIVEGGNYEYKLNNVEEILKLEEELNNNEIISREPIYSSRRVDTDNSNLEKNYVEIDLTRQKVWLYINGELKVETDCVTGCVNKGHDTPTGIYALRYKEKNRVLRGRKLSNGRYEYQAFVNYWMPFNGGIGLHDATWRKKFGDDIYITNGSHGCINLPMEKAKIIYENIDKNMPIIVYKS